MSVVDLARDRLHRARGHHRLDDAQAFVAPLRGGVGIEIGGPSAVFRGDGALPAYPALARVDGVQFSDETWWHGKMDAGAYDTGEPGRSDGRLYIAEGSDLSALDDDSVDAILSSHVIEHFANPVGALREWLRVLRPGGHLLVVAPHKEGTFDHRRPVTTLEHLLEDDARGTDEDDETHVEEVLALHDVDRDPPAQDRAAFEARVRDNLTHRMVHHHVFVTRSVVGLLDHLGLAVRAVEARWPHDIYVLAQLPAADDPAPDNSLWLAHGARWARRSPFRLDRS